MEAEERHTQWGGKTGPSWPLDSAGTPSVQGGEARDRHEPTSIARCAPRAPAATTPPRMVTRSGPGSPGRAPSAIEVDPALQLARDAAQGLSAASPRQEEDEERPLAPVNEAPPSSRMASLGSLQSLAVHMHNQAELRAKRQERLQAALTEELAANAAVQAEIDALRGEVAQDKGLLSGELEGGEEHRATKILVEERERHEALGQQVTTMQDKLVHVSGAIKQLAKQRKQPAADEIIDQDSTEVLAHLEMLTK